MVDSIINFIRSVLYPPSESRKRRISAEEDNPNRSKIRRISVSNMSTPNEDDWPSGSSETLKRRLALGTRPRTNWAKENMIHVIDDDVTEVSKGKHRISYMETLKGKTPQFTSSTPNCSYSQRVLHQNGEDDVVFLGNSPSFNANKLNENKQGFDYIKPYSSHNNGHNRTKCKISSNGTVGYDADRALSNKVREIKEKFNFKRYKRNYSTNQSFKLDEKAKYQKLLAQAAPSSLNIVKNSFTKYSTPCGKLFLPGRGTHILNLAKATEEKKLPNFIDLTSDENSRKPNKLSTRDTILKVLDGSSWSGPIVIKDCDSEVEFPTPPSPKPDIQVERVNSLKKIVDTSESTHAEWLTKLVQNYREDLSKTVVEINTQSSQKDKLSAVTSEVYTRRLEDQMVKCLKIKDAVLPVVVSKDTVLPELTEEEESRISVALNKRGNPSEILVEKFNMRVSRRDIQTLAGLNWLNDEVINFYMNLIIERGKLPEWPNVYAMNTFFYPKLQKSGHASLKRWTRRVDIFSYDIIAVPIHLGVHWCMSIINFSTKTIEYYDSMGGANRCCLQLLLEYLKEEHLDKKKVDYDVSGWSLESMIDIPQQMNGSDCGMFSCTFAEFIARGAKISFSQEDMPYLRRKMVLEILNGELLIT